MGKTELILELKSEMRSFTSNENIHKKEGGSYYVVSANKASSVTLQSPGNESQRKHSAILRSSSQYVSCISDFAFLPVNCFQSFSCAKKDESKQQIR